VKVIALVVVTLAGVVATIVAEIVTGSSWVTIGVAIFATVASVALACAEGAEREVTTTRDERDPAMLGLALLARQLGAGFDRIVPRTLSELADAAPLDVPSFATAESIRSEFAFVIDESAGMRAAPGYVRDANTLESRGAEPTS
jgi:hypothetical protein